jgi:hypothetical protein
MSTTLTRDGDGSRRRRGADARGVRLLRRHFGLVVGLWLVSVVEFSVAAGWFTAELTSSTADGVSGGVMTALLGGGVPVLGAWRLRGRL